MGVLIEGMEMPDTCTRCDYIGLNVAIGCKVVTGTNGRADNCPLTEVPEPHGRLGDLDDIIKRAKKWIDHPDKYISQRNKDMIYILEREDAIIPASEEE